MDLKETVTVEKEQYVGIVCDRCGMEWRYGEQLLPPSNFKIELNPGDETEAILYADLCDSCFAELDGKIHDVLEMSLNLFPKAWKRSGLFMEWEASDREP